MLGENLSQHLEELKCKDGDKNEPSSDVQSVRVPTSASDNNMIGSDSWEDGQNVDDKNKMEQSITLTQEQGPSNSDNFVLDERQSESLKFVGESNELGMVLDSNILENRIDSVGSNPESENFVEKEILDGNERTDCLKLENEVEKTLQKNIEQILPLSNQQPIRQKPGVILLGRGNSFSRGRSEVIVLHHRPKSSRDKLSGKHGTISTKEKKLVTISERRGSVENEDVVKLNVRGESDVMESNECQEIPSSSPPPISNGMYHPALQQTDLSEDRLNGNSSSCIIEPVSCYQDNLQDLWHKAESIMALKNDKVHRILEEFGIGKPGGGGGEDENYWEDDDVKERKEEEEEVWQIVQESSGEKT